MNSDSGKEFDRNMNQLVRLLKKIIKSLPGSGSMPSHLFPPKGKDKESNVQVNFCFFNFLPMSEEDLEELDEIYDQFLEDEEDKNFDFSQGLNPADLDFLRRNGIRF